MTTITTYAGKGSQLTTAEVDANFNNLNADKVENSAAFTSTNLIINTFADVKQRSTRDSAGYLYDRFIQSSGVTNPAWTADKLFDNCFQLNASGDYIEQRVERINVRRLYDSAKAFTTSAYLDVSSAGNLSVILDYPTVIDNYAATASIVVDTFSVALGTSRIARQVTLPDEAYANGARVRIQSAGAVCKVNGLKCERGGVATPLEFWKIGRELTDCQRYLRNLTGASTPLAVGQVNGSSSLYFTVAGNMRDVPSVTYSGLAVNDSLVSIAVTALSVTGSTNSTISLRATASGLTDGRCGMLTSTSSDYLQLSSEL